MREFGAKLWESWMSRHDINSRLQQYGQFVRDRLHADFARAGVTYPPASLALLAFKQERRLEVYAANSQSAPFRYICSYPILGSSGTLGPKLREGDGQVPEGLYRVENLNPNSRFHLAIRVNYPNAFDLANAVREQRANPGSDT